MPYCSALAQPATAKASPTPLPMNHAQQILFTVNELSVPELLHESGPMTGAQLAAATGANREYLERVLRAAARMGLISMSHPAVKTAAARGAKPAAAAAGTKPPGRFDLGGAVYGLTQLSAVLCDAHPNSVKAMVSLFADHYGPAGRLLEGVRQGAVPYELFSGGRSHWDHMAAEPELYSRFNK